MPQTKKLTLRERLALYDRGKKPVEKLSERQKAAGRLDRLGTPQQAYLPGSAQARADSVASGTPLASEVHAEKMKARRQARLDKQRRLKDVQKVIRDITMLLREKSLNDKGQMVGTIPLDSEDRIEMENQKAALKKERDELEGKTPKSKSGDPEGLYP